MLPGNYGRATLDKRRLGDLVDLVSNKINFVDEESRKQDTLGRVYEYFLSQFASQEGTQGRRVLYAAFGGARAGGDARPVQGHVSSTRAAARAACSCRAEKFVEAHGGRIGDISVYGQESNPNT